jgi:hypothetical protein
MQGEREMVGIKKGKLCHGRGEHLLASKILEALLRLY